MLGETRKPLTEPSSSWYRWKHPKRVQLYATLGGVFAVATGIMMRQRTIEPETMGPTTRTAGVMAAFGPCSTSLEQKAAQRLLSEKQEERKRLGLKEVHGVFPNEWVAKKLNEWFGPPDPKPTSPPMY